MEILRLIAQDYELTGRVRVFCRVRPSRLSATSTISISNKKKIVIGRPEAAQREEEFLFDQVFGPRDSQLDVFKGVSDVAQAVLDGHDAVFLAYGQTCSGKKPYHAW